MTPPSLRKTFRALALVFFALSCRLPMQTPARPAKACRLRRPPAFRRTRQPDRLAPGARAAGTSDVLTSPCPNAIPRIRMPPPAARDDLPLGVIPGPRSGTRNPERQPCPPVSAGHVGLVTHRQRLGHGGKHPPSQLWVPGSLRAPE